MANNKERDLDASIGDQNTFQGQSNPKMEDLDTKSLGDQATFAGGRAPANPKSLGDQVTFGGGADQGDFEDDDMEIVDLTARYKVEKTLGKGGMGEVLLATDTRLDRKVAIKRILGDAARSKTAVNRFLTEAKSIAALNHPNVVQIYDYGRAQDGPFLIMEYVDGSSLLDRCRDGALPLEEAVDLACQLCDGLGRAHDVGIIHRDIKPANVLMTTDGIPKLTDFGLAKAETADTGMTMAGAILGTLDFMPPEQRRDAALTDVRSDLWSLAATLYQIVAGESPRVIDLDLCPKELRGVLGQGLKTKPEQRFQSSREFKEALHVSLNAAKRPAPQPTTDLGAGECPSCHSVNESHRKFCRECGDPLRCKCLKCEHEIPVWDKVCPECGGKQAELVASRLQKIEGQREHADRKKDQHHYQEAIVLAQGIAAIDDRRLNQHQSWAIEFIEATKTEWVRQKDLAAQHYEEAKKHREAFDYDAAIQAVESIPEPLRSSQLKEYLWTLIAEQQESAALIDTIKSRISERAIDGLLPLVEKAVSLRGDRADLRKLLEQLRDQEAKLKRKKERVLVADLNKNRPHNETTLTNSIGMQLKLLPFGTFTMGEGFKSQRVTLTKPIYIGVYEVTQAQYQQVMGENPSSFKGAQNPIERISWEGANDFCIRLSTLPEEQSAGRIYRLPTEAEWEYACRAGTTTAYSFGDDDDQLGGYAWFDGNSGGTTHPVGQKKPNAWGLYDMHGNVWEWCADWYGDYPGSPLVDPSGPRVGPFRVRRGGSCFFEAEYCRSACRPRLDPSFRFDDCGFRVALSSLSGIPGSP